MKKSEFQNHIWLRIQISSYFPCACFQIYRIQFPERKKLVIQESLIAMAAAFLIPFEVKKPKLTGKISLLLLGIMCMLAALTGGMNV